MMGAVRRCTCILWPGKVLYIEDTERSYHACLREILQKASRITWIYTVIQKKRTKVNGSGRTRDMVFGQNSNIL
jgi:hypothetical protein